MYAKYIKRVLDILLSSIAIILLIPLFLVLILVGFVMMKGNPFFIQKRPGRYEKIFNLIKFRTMTNEKDKNGELLPDEKRLIPYGKFLRATSLDELPELFNIFCGQMSIIGPRPLLIKYLPRYNSEQKRRHDVRPGLTGYAQANGRNSLSWEEKFKMDVWYVDNISFKLDVKIFWDTIITVLKHDGINGGGEITMSEFLGNEDNDL